MRITATQIIKNVNLTTTQEVVRRIITVAPLGERGFGVPADGNDGEILAKDGVIPFATKWIPNTGGGGGISDAPNNANAYVRSGLSWVIGYTKTAIDSLITSSLVGYATQSWVNSQGFITNVITALGFTPYNATNPSGFQTAGQVTTAISNRINNEPYSAEWLGDNNAANKDVLHTQFEVVQGQIDGITDINTGDETASTIISKIGDGTKINQSYLPSYVDDVLEFANLSGFPVTGEIGKIYIAISPSNIQYRWSGSAYIAITNGLIATTNELSEGVNNLYFTSARVLATVLTGVSFLTGGAIVSTDTVLIAFGKIQKQINDLLGTVSKYPSTATNGKFLQGNGTNYVEVDAPSGGVPEIGVYSFLANNSNIDAIPTENAFKNQTEQVYSGAITWSTTAPTVILSNTYKFQIIGSSCEVRVSLSYTNPATNSQVIIALPSDCPIPATITGFTSASEIIAFGSGMIFLDRATLPASAGRYCLLRRNSANTGYELVVTHGSAISVRNVQLTIQYFT
jgi:hypothetical protein